MAWKEQLKIFESNGEWDIAIELMLAVIQEHPDEVDAYIYILFLLKNLLIEEDYNKNKRTYYVSILYKYFDKSYKKFLHNAEYLFCTGWTASMCPWYFGIEREDADKMIHTALILEPNNIFYQTAYYIELDRTITKNQIPSEAYARLILQDDSAITIAIKSRGALGECILGCMRGWAKEVLGLYPYDSSKAKN